MKSFTKTIALFTVALMVSFPSFATASPDFTACKKAVELGKASWYEPSFVAKVTKVGKNEEVRALEAPMCVYMHVVGGWKVVPLNTGTKLVFPKGENQPLRHATCNNDTRGAEYVGSVPTPTPTPALAPAPVAQPVVVVQQVLVVEQPAPAVTPVPTPTVTASDCKDCTPNRKTEEGVGGKCELRSGRPFCNFEWKVLRTQDQQQNCGCQIKVSTTGQVIGFLDAMPGSPRCLQQKNLWANALGFIYDNSRPPH